MGSWRSFTKKPAFLIGIFFFFSTFVGFATALLYFGYSDVWVNVDWRFFNSLSLLLQSNLFHYHRFPLHDPWLCGGMDLVTNPQTRIFSPMVIFDLLFWPKLANLLSIIFYASVGHLAMYRLLRHLNLSRFHSALGASIFINSSWFGLHYAVGHVVYGAFQLLPWVMYLALRFHRPRCRLWLTVLMAWFLLDGAVYTFIFSGMLIVSLICVRKISVKELFKVSIRQPIFHFTLVVLFLLLSAPRIIPTLQAFSKRGAYLDYAEIPFQKWMYLFFNVFQDGLANVGWSPYQAHEFSVYLGITLTFCVFYNLKDHLRLQKAFPYLVLIVFWAWVALGVVPEINPWQGFLKIPLFHNAHIQSRVLILMQLFWVIAAMFTLEQFQSRKKFHAALVGLILLETLVAKNFPFYALAHDSYVMQGTSVQEYVTSEGLTETIGHGDAPSHYYFPNKGSSECYEPAKPKIGAIPTDDFAHYEGEAFPLDRAGNVQIVRYTPGDLHIRYDLVGPGKIRINTNQLEGWQVVEGQVQVQESMGGSLDLLTRNAQGDAWLQYRPAYWIRIFIFYGLGAVLLAILLWNSRLWEYAPVPKHGLSKKS